MYKGKRILVGKKRPSTTSKKYRGKREIEVECNKNVITIDVKSEWYAMISNIMLYVLSLSSERLKLLWDKGSLMSIGVVARWDVCFYV